MITTAAGVLAEAINDFKSSATAMRVVGRRAGLVNRLDIQGFYDCFKRSLKRALLFLKKKKQKNFYDFGATPVSRARPKVIKIFLVTFFKKVTACFL